MPLPTWETVEPSDAPEPWDGKKYYRKGARCIHKGSTWRADYTDIYNSSFEPGGFQPGCYWVKES